jgi:hypothetical protein
MTSKKGKGNISPEGDINFRLETEATHRRSLIIRIGLRYERDGAQLSSAKRRDEDVPREVSNLMRQLRLPRTLVDNT